MDKDLIGPKASSGMRATAKNYGKKKLIGVIRNGKYVDAVTGEPIVISSKKRVFSKVLINNIGGLE